MMLKRFRIEVHVRIHVKIKCAGKMHCLNECPWSPMYMYGELVLSMYIVDKVLDFHALVN